MVEQKNDLNIAQLTETIKILYYRALFDIYSKLGLSLKNVHLKL